MSNQLKELSPTDLTFHSFRHSQGDFILQLNMLRYITYEYEAKPSFELEEPQLKKYLDRLESGNKTHVPFIAPFTHDGLLAEIDINVSDLEKSYSQEDTEFKQSGRQGMVQHLLERLLSRESTFLDTNEKWPKARKYPRASGEERRAARITSGKASYLYLYGYKGKPTGSVAFDGMYRDMWQMTEATQNGTLDNSDLCGKIEAHRDLLRTAEIKYLGRTVLAPALESVA